LVIVGEGVLANDSDPDGDSLKTQLVDGVDHGLLTLRADGSFTYVPEVSFVGLDSFRYTAFDGLASSNEVLVAITVGEEVNMPPVAVQDTYVIRRGNTLTVAAPGILGNDYDVNDDPITAQLGTGVAHGNLSFHTDGSFTYTPDDGFVGMDQFTYRAYDGELTSSLVTVTIKVMLINFMTIVTK
jgi:VCBS repeat-containing protein